MADYLRSIGAVFAKYRKRSRTGVCIVCLEMGEVVTKAKLEVDHSDQCKFRARHSEQAPI